MFWFSPKKEIKYEEGHDDEEAQEEELEQPVKRRSQESKSFLTYLGFGTKKKTEPQPESDSEDGNISGDEADENADVGEKIFWHRAGLPANFAEDVLDLEMKIEGFPDFTQKDVDQLVYLYSQAMEYYEGVSVDKYNSFKDRIQKLLVNPMVFSRMKNQETKTRDRWLTDYKKPASLISISKNAPKWAQGPLKPINEQLFLGGSKQSKEKKLDMSMRVLETADQNEEEKTKIISKYDQFEKRKSTIVHSDISSQTVNLQKRLAQRKFKRSSTKTQGNGAANVKFTEHQQSIDSNDSGGFCSKPNIEELSGLTENDISLKVTQSKGNR